MMIGENQKKRKKQLIISITAIVLLIVATVGVTYAFFNYTRTGSPNNIATGRIYFNTTQDGRLNLTNIFPVKSTEVNANELDSVTVGIVGDTTYTDGEEFQITLVDVTNTINSKKIPINYIATYTANNSGVIGSSSDDYWNARNSKDATIYQLNATGSVEEDTQILVGYIDNGATGINGTLTIKAYIDADRIAISDTYDGTETDNMGTTTDWVNGRTVFTTTEWNSFQANGVSFQVKVEANEGIWVEEVLSRNDMANFNTYGAELISSAQRSTITEISFIRMSEEMIDTHTNLINLTAADGEGLVKAWVDGTKLYIASPGETYFPVDSMGLFGNYSNVTRINFNNINTSNVTNMGYMFVNCNSLASIDLSSLNTRNVTNMGYMFSNNTNLVSISLSSFDTSNVTNMEEMFSYNTSLSSIDLSSLNTSSVTNMRAMFSNCSSLTSIDLNSFDTSNVTSMLTMFSNCSSLTSIDLSDLGGDNLSMADGIFQGCTNLRTINMSGFDFGKLHEIRFSSFTNLVSVNLDNADTSSLTSMYSMFSGDSSLTTVSMANIDTSNVTNMEYMFSNCTGLVNFALNGLNTENVTNFNQMFSGCSNLVTLDLSNFNMTSANNINLMFQYCGALTTIYVSNTWNVSNVNNSDHTFYNCTSLVGGAGTTYDANHDDKEYARVDGGSSNPGYLTLRTN